MINEEEYKKCLESPAYFYNNYVLIRNENGEYVKPEPVTDEQIETAIGLYEKEFRKRHSVGFAITEKTIFDIIKKMCLQ